MYFFSIHPNVEDIGNHAKYSKGWSVKMFNSVGALGQACTTHLNSPIVWTCGVRKADNFLYSDFLVLDVDDDKMMGLDRAIDYYSRYIHVIGTTKSHNLLKGELVSERYRVFVALEKRIQSAEHYKGLCMQESCQHGGDWQASSPAMHFMPLNRIVSYSEVGRKMPIGVIPPRRQVKRKPVKFETDAIGSVAKQIPPYIQDWLDGNVRQGERNITAFKIACTLRKLNFKEDEIVEIILSSSLPLDGSSKTIREVKNTVRSAMRRK